MKVLFALVFVLVGCTSTPPPREELTYGGKPATGATRIFLIAGSNDSANFAEEIVRHRREWLRRGAKPVEIACYYAAPADEGWNQDHEQFRTLKSELSTCRRADYETIRRDVERAAKAAPDYVFFYLSGHGHEGPRHALRMDVDGDDDLTVGKLEALLRSYPARTRKIVAVQGCFSGGFLEPWIDGKRRGNIPAEISGLTMLTASASNRMSFGCYSGEQLTDFGEAFLDAIGETTQLPNRIPWRRVHEKLVDNVESAERVRVHPSERSTPQFFSNVSPAE